MTFKPYSKEQSLNRGLGLDSDDFKRYKDRPTKWLKAKATEKCNEYIRLRDRDGNHFTCVSCHERKMIKVVNRKSNYHAGHYYSGGEYPALRYDEINLGGECSRCNFFSGDHLIGFRETIIQRHGLKELERLEMLAKYNKRVRKKWTRIELIEIINHYTSKIKKLKNDN